MERGEACVNNKTLKLAVCILVPAVILLLPVPNGLTLAAWRLFAMYMAAIFGLVLRPYDEAVILLAVIAASGLIFGNMGALLSGYASTTAWLVFSAFMIGTAFTSTGLGKRIAYYLIGKFGETPLKLGYVAALTDFVISPATPSNTARTGGIVYPHISKHCCCSGFYTGRHSPSYRRILDTDPVLYQLYDRFYLSYGNGAQRIDPDLCPEHPEGQRQLDSMGSCRDCSWSCDADSDSVGGI